MSKKDRFCIDCGKPCWGHRCKDCFSEGRYNSLSRINSRRRYREQVQH